MELSEPLGPTDLAGWTVCHGCNVAVNTFSSRWEHSPDCPGLCVRPDCPNHPKV